MTLINAFFFLMLLATAGIIWLILDGWWGFEQENRQANLLLIHQIHQQQSASTDYVRHVLNQEVDTQPVTCDAQGFFLVATAEASTLPTRLAPAVTTAGQNKDAA